MFIRSACVRIYSLFLTLSLVLNLLNTWNAATCHAGSDLKDLETLAKQTFVSPIPPAHLSSDAKIIWGIFFAEHPPVTDFLHLLVRDTSGEVTTDHWLHTRFIQAIHEIAKEPQVKKAIQVGAHYFDAYFKQLEKGLQELDEINPGKASVRSLEELLLQHDTKLNKPVTQIEAEQWALQDLSQKIPGFNNTHLKDEGIKRDYQRLVNKYLMEERPKRDLTRTLAQEIEKWRQSELIRHKRALEKNLKTIIKEDPFHLLNYFEMVEMSDTGNVVSPPIAARKINAIRAPPFEVRVDDPLARHRERYAFKSGVHTGFLEKDLVIEQNGKKYSLISIWDMPFLSTKSNYIEKSDLHTRSRLLNFYSDPQTATALPFRFYDDRWLKTLGSLDPASNPYDILNTFRTLRREELHQQKIFTKRVFLGRSPWPISGTSPLYPEEALTWNFMARHDGFPGSLIDVNGGYSNSNIWPLPLKQTFLQSANVSDSPTLAHAPLRVDTNHGVHTFTNRPEEDVTQFIIQNNTQKEAPTSYVIRPHEEMAESHLIQSQSLEPKSLSIKSAESQLFYGDSLPIPTPDQHRLHAIEIRDLQGNLLTEGVDFELRESPNKTGTFIKALRPEIKEVHYQAQFKPNSYMHMTPDLRVSSSQLIEVAQDLEAIDEKFISKALRKKAATLHPNQSIDLETFSALFQKNAKYAKSTKPKKSMPHTIGHKRLAEFESYVHQGRVYYQCSGAECLQTTVQSALFKDEPRFSIQGRAVIVQKGNKLSWKNLHAENELFWDNRVVKVLDATPGSSDQSWFKSFIEKLKSRPIERRPPVTYSREEMKAFERIAAQTPTQTALTAQLQESTAKAKLQEFWRITAEKKQNLLRALETAQIRVTDPSTPIARALQLSSGALQVDQDQSIQLFKQTVKRTREELKLLRLPAQDPKGLRVKKWQWPYRSHVLAETVDSLLEHLENMPVPITTPQVAADSCAAIVLKAASAP